jgi:hypothetical protein
MGLAQKAFLSAQTGGPGGLMGAFQIEKMLKEGDIEGVFKKVRDQMQKQLGPIVTLEDAASSPAAAAQLARQTAMLRSGPLGAMARTDQDAYRILESMKTGAPPPAALGDTVQAAMGRGEEMEARRSLTVVKDIKDIIAEADLAGGMAALKFLQAGGAGGIGFGGTVSAAQAARMSEMKGSQRAAAIRSGEIIGKQQEAFTKGSSKELEGVVGTSMAASVEDLTKSISNISSNVLKSAKEHLQQLVSSNSSDEDIRNTYDELTSKAQAEAASLRKQGKGKEAAKLLTDVDEVGRQMQLARTPAELRGIMQVDTEEQAKQNILESALPTSDKIKKATGKAVTLDESKRSPEAGAAYARQQSGMQSEGNEVYLKVTAICDGCKNPLETHYVRATSPAATISP